MSERVEEMLEACMTGDLDAVVEMLADAPELARARGFDIETTALILAAHRGFSDLVEPLLDAGADVAAEEGASRSCALHWACEGGHAAVVSTLLDRGASAAGKDAWYDLAPMGWTAVPMLMPDIHDDRAACARLLAERGATVDPFTCVAHGWLDRLDREGVSQRLGFAGRGATPLHFAVDRGDSRAVRALLDLGANSAQCDDWGVSAHAIALARFEDIVPQFEGQPMDLSARLVLGTEGAAADFDPASDPGLLHFMAEHGLAEPMRRVLAAGADVDGEVRWLSNELPATMTALQAAVGRAQPEAVAVLLEAGANPNRAPEATGVTPLHAAASRGDARIARLLLDHDADRCAVDREHGATPSEWAQFFGHPALAPHLAPET